MSWFKPKLGTILTTHFTVQEAICKHCGRIPDLEAVLKTAQWMEQVRHEVYEGRIVHVLSWCRCPEHNAAVGGVSDSFHMKAMAVDHVVKDLTPVQAYSRVLKFQGKGKLVGGAGKYRGFCHIDRGPARRWSG